jgi:hypothetical protein
MSQPAGDDAYEIRRNACNILSRMHPENEEERGNIDSLNESYSKLSLSPNKKKGTVQAPPISSYQNGPDVHARISHNNGSSGEDPHRYRSNDNEEGWGVMEYVVQCISDACKAAASASAVRYQDGATGTGGGSQRYQDRATGFGTQQQARPTDMSFAGGGYQNIDTDPLIDGHRPAHTKGSFQQVPLPSTYRSRESL